MSDAIQIFMGGFSLFLAAILCRIGWEVGGDIVDRFFRG